VSAWDWVYWLFNPPHGLSLGLILLMSFILGLLHGATPDEHTWPITFSYAVGAYSTRRGMKAGFLFSLGSPEGSAHDSWLPGPRLLLHEVQP